jgi:hypothetical protein
MGIQGMSYRAWLIFFFFEMGCQCVAQAGIQLLDSRDPTASASLLASTIGASQGQVPSQYVLVLCFFDHILYAVKPSDTLLISVILFFLLEFFMYLKIHYNPF